MIVFAVFRWRFEIHQNNVSKLPFGVRVPIDVGQANDLLLLFFAIASKSNEIVYETDVLPEDYFFFLYSKRKINQKKSTKNLCYYLNILKSTKSIE